MDEHLTLYTVMERYARKVHSPIVDIKNLIFFLEQNAKRFAQEKPEWVAWAINPSGKVFEELPNLVHDKTHRVVINELKSAVFLINFYEKMLREAYETEESEDGPFPHEQSINITIPSDMVKTINLEKELGSFLDEPQENTPTFVKILFDRYGSALILPDLIPRRFPEKALQKIRNFLRGNNNKDYFQNKMIPAFRGRENHLKDMFTRILTRPGECLDELESAREFSYSFWAYFCNLLLGITSSNDELTPADIGILQSIAVLENFNNYYKIKIGKIKTRDTALKNLSLALGKPPFLYSLDAIMKFTDNKGLPLLGQYSQEDLDAFLRGRTTSTEGDQLPELLIIRDMNGVQQFVKKSVLIPCCMKLLSEARQPVKKAVTDRWFKLLKDLDHEPAMNDDEAFEKLLNRTTKTAVPSLISILRDNRLYMVYQEMLIFSSSPPVSLPELFVKGKLLPLSDLLKFTRKQILADIRLLLPFWYSIPFLSRVIEHIMRLFKRKKIYTDKMIEKKEDENENFTESNRGSLLKTSIAETAAVLIPKGKTLDEALMELENRWGVLHDSKAKKNLIEDVNSLVRDRLRRTLRLQKSPRVTPDALKRLASAIVTESPTLQTLGGRDSLIFYIELYIIKLIQRSEY
jgi:hypothetical protein